jgi:squalene-hopene/tetraprenyl-beta-curcumene cyclase
MRRVALFLSLVLALCVGVLVVWAGIRVRANSVASLGSYRSNWSPAAAASYLDSREAWWQSWPPAQRSEGTVCLSCHTVVPYAFVRPELSAELGQAGMTVAETKMLSSIEKRVTDWDKVDYYYSDPAHAEPSHATEAILNAVILARYATQQSQLMPIARRAFDEAWALQESTGADAGGWQWQDFHEAPWESPESAYQGAAMMAMAAEWMPGSYASDADVGGHMARLRQYLLKNYDEQPLLNQLYVLWASTETPGGLLNDAQRKELMAKVAALQREDGGWSLDSLDQQKTFKRAAFDLFKRANNVDGSDGVATGLVVLAAEKAGTPANDPMLKRGLAWLEAHQYQDGNWWASSMNGFRDPASGMGHFMSDAATGYAVMALQQSPSAMKAAAAEGKGSRTGKAANADQAAGYSWNAPRPPQ